METIDTITQTKLEKTLFKIQKCFDPHILQDLGVREFKDVLLDQMVEEIRFTLFGRVARDIRYPQDWWQAFRERWYPRWLIKFYPIKYKRIIIKALYPEMALHNQKIIFYIEENIER